MSDQVSSQKQATIGDSEQGTVTEVICTRLACPVQCKLRTRLPTSNTCASGFKDCAHVKDHLKRYHSCNCTFADGLEACYVPAHVSKALMKKILYGMKRRTNGTSEREKWEKIYRLLDPDNEAEFPPAYLPTGAQLRAIARVPPEEEFLKSLEARLEKVAGASRGGQIRPAYRFFLEFLQFYDLVSREGTLPCPRLPILRREEQTTAQWSAEEPVTVNGSTVAANNKSWEDMINWAGFSEPRELV